VIVKGFAHAPAREVREPVGVARGERLVEAVDAAQLPERRFGRAPLARQFAERVAAGGGKERERQRRDDQKHDDALQRSGENQFQHAGDSDCLWRVLAELIAR
jgi:hypothetical protein